MSKILLATEKPFAADAVQKIKNAVAESQHTLTILESYTDQQQLHEAIADADALIIRSDKVDRAVIEAGLRELNIGDIIPINSDGKPVSDKAEVMP